MNQQIIQIKPDPKGKPPVPTKETEGQKEVKAGDSRQETAKSSQQTVLEKSSEKEKVVPDSPEGAKKGKRKREKIEITNDKVSTTKFGQPTSSDESRFRIKRKRFQQRAQDEIEDADSAKHLEIDIPSLKSNIRIRRRRRKRVSLLKIGSSLKKTRNELMEGKNNNQIPSLAKMIIKRITDRTPPRTSRFRVPRTKPVSFGVDTDGNPNSVDKIKKLKIGDNGVKVIKPLPPKGVPPTLGEGSPPPPSVGKLRIEEKEKE